MTLPRPWIPLDQDDELDGLTEDSIEEHVQTLKVQITQTQENLRARDHQVERDVEAGELAEQVAETLASSGMDAPADVIQDANTIVRQEDERTIADLRKELEEAENLKRLHDEVSYGQAWLNACSYLRELERDALQRLTHTIDQITAAAVQLTLPSRGVVILALPSGTQEFDLRYWQEQTVKMGKQLSKETKELTVKVLATPTRAEEKSNVVLQAAFKIAQFVYYAASMARVAGDALKQVLAHFHQTLEHFLPMLSITVK